MSSFEVVIERIALGGSGIARTGGRTIMVPGVCAGERVRVVMAPAPKGKARHGAELAVLDVLEPSPDRVVPPCPYVGACGGCDFMHVAEARQLEILAGLVRDQLVHATKSDAVPPPTLTRAPRSLAYRTRARLAFHARTSKKGSVEIGYRRTRSHDLVAIDRCAVLDLRLDAALGEARVVLEGSDSRGDISLALGAGGKPVLELHPESDLAPAAYGRLDAATNAGRLAGARVFSRGASTPIVFGDPRIEQTGPDGGVLRMAPGSFAQPSDDGAALLSLRLKETIEALVPAATRERARVVELFSGSGTLTVTLASMGFASLAAVEIDRAACAEAKANLGARGLRANVVSADAETHTIPPATDLVVLDPPRTGARGATAAIIAAKTRAVVYVSCDPATLARDVEAFAAAGYSIRSLDVLELFPQTSHVETIVALARQKPA